MLLITHDSYIACERQADTGGVFSQHPLVQFSVPKLGVFDRVPFFLIYTENSIIWSFLVCLIYSRITTKIQRNPIYFKLRNIFLRPKFLSGLSSFVTYILLAVYYSSVIPSKVKSDEDKSIL